MMSKRSIKRRGARPVRALKLAPLALSRSNLRKIPAAMIAQRDGADGDGKAPSPTQAPSPAVDALPVILIEDNRLLLEGLTSMLSTQGLKLIATARTGTEALQEVARLRPHLVLIDATLGDRDCVHLVQAVKKVFPDMKIIVMHLLAAHSDLVAFVRAGVSGFIMKDASVADIVSTIRTVADGGSVLPPPVAGTLFSHVAEQTTSKRAVKAAIRERSVPLVVS